MKDWSDCAIFNHPWEVMVRAAYRKYPNPQNPSVIALDTLERRVFGSKLYSHRLFTTLWSVPPIVLKIIGANDVMYIHEESVCDVQEKSLVVVGRNLTLRNLFRMDEFLQYIPHPDDPSKTLLRQTASMSVFGIPLLGDLLESLLINSYSSVVSKGRQAVECKALMLEDSSTPLPCTSHCTQSS